MGELHKADLKHTKETIKDSIKPKEYLSVSRLEKKADAIYAMEKNKPLINKDIRDKSVENYNREKLYSSYQERINRTPKENGHWTGERGESKFISNNSEANKYLKQSNMDGIKYKNGIPDFSGCSKGNVRIKDMTERRLGKDGNFTKADIALAKQKGCSPRDVRTWRGKNGYTWHECNDRKTCQKIPSVVNHTFGHLGGVGECQRMQDNKQGGIFDE